MNPGETITLKTVYTTARIVMDGQSFEKTVKSGAVVRARPGPVVPGDEYIALVTDEGQHRWNAPLAEYDPDTVDDEPAEEPRWKAV